MAIFVTVTAFDLFTVDLNFYVRTLSGAQLFNNSYYQIDGVTYEDTYGVDSTYGYSIVFSGRGLSQNVFGDITAGTVQLIAELENGNLLWFIKDFSYSATSLYSAALTASNSDELSIVRSILSGNDLIFLSGGGDRIDAYGGNDEVRGNGGNDTLYGGDVLTQLFLHRSRC